jgi:hypothetical protein
MCVRERVSECVINHDDNEDDDDDHDDDDASGQ